MNNNPHDFIEKILSINAPTSNMFGGGIPGMVGSAIIGRGIGSSAYEVLYQLKSQAVLLGKAYAQHADAEAVAALAKPIEASLMTVQVIGVLSEEQTNALIDDLLDLTQPA